MPSQKSAPPKKRGRGRPTVYTPELRDRAAMRAVSGATDMEMAEELKISLTTFYRWRHEHPDFREALQVGKDAADDRVEAALYHRAVGYSHPSLKIMQNNGRPVIVPFTEHVAPDIGAITLWLTNRRGDRWKSKQAIEGAGPGSEPITVQILPCGGAPSGEAHRG